MVKNKFIFIYLVFSVTLSSAQAPTTSLGSQPVPVVLQNSVPGATNAPRQGQLPRSVDHRSLLPKPGYQDRINSCVGWASAYAARTFLENFYRGWGVDAQNKVFSPSFVYNQINGGQDRGSSIIHAVDLFKNQGAATLQTMPYTLDFTLQPPPQAKQEATQFVTDGYERLDPKNTLAIKTVLASGNVVIFGMRTFENFTRYRGGVYDKVEGANLGGHAMALIGYDDSKNAFLLINSWSEQWGEQGYGWINYNTFGELTHTAVVIKARPISRPERLNPPNRIEASLGTFRDRIQVSWNEVLNVEGYIVHRSESNTGPFREIARVEGTVFLDQRADQGKMYFYTIKSFGPNGESEFSPIANGFVQVPQVLGIPQNVQVRVVGANVQLLWSPVESATSYNIYRFDDALEKFRLIGSSRDQGFQDTSAQKPGQYWYVVSAVRGQEESAASQSVSATVSSPPIVTTPPPAQPSTPSAPSSPTPQPQAQPTPRPTVPTAPPRTQPSPQPAPQPTAPAVTTLSLVRHARATQGQFSNKIELSWQAVPGAQQYRVEVLEPRQSRYRVVGTTQAPRFVFETTNTNPHYFAIIPLAGQTEGPRLDYIMGFASRQVRRSTTRFADQNYRDQFRQPTDERFNRAQQLFQNDQFFSNSDKFFDNFVPADFFFIDVEKFFEVDEKFFDADDFFN